MGRTRTLEIDVPDPAMRRIEFEAGRGGMTTEGYVREVIMREVDVMPRWSFEVEFDEGLAAEHGTSVGELYGIVADIAERNGNVRVGRNMWMAGEDGYSVAGKEDLGVRFYRSEDDARAYAEQSIEGTADRVREILESSEWGSGYRGITPTRAPEVEFADGGIAYRRGEFPGTMVLRGPADGDWEAGDHSGACDISVASLSDVGSGVSVPQYKGIISVGGERVDFVLTLKDQAQLDIGQWSPFVAAA